MFYCLETETNVAPKKPGIYMLIALNTRCRPKPLARVGGIDKQGVLYIGRGKSLRSRLNMLRRMLFDGTRGGHIAGRTYWASPPVQKLACPSRVAFCFVATENDRAREKKQLRAYFCKYGEVPPLNGQAEFIAAGP